MNERIKELALECYNPYSNFDINKFAELIVRECSEVAHCNFHVDGLTLGSLLKEHFGIEE